MAENQYDLIVIGSGPAGQKAAIRAAKLNKKVAVVERKTVVGGVCINTGTIPSKTLREAVLYLSGYTQRGFYGTSYSVKQNITIDDLLYRTDLVIQNEIDVTRSQLYRNGVEVINAEASFADSHTISLTSPEGAGNRKIKAKNIIIATGTTATRDPNIAFDGQRIFTSDDILHLNSIPKTIAVVGGGVIGTEYASIFAALGVRVTLIDKRNELLSFVDDEIIDSLVYHLRQNRVILRLNEEVKEIKPIDDDSGKMVELKLNSGKRVRTEMVLYSVGRSGATARLNLEAAGIKPDQRGRLAVNENFQTEVPHIYAVGDVIGFPSLASTSMEQGRMASSHAFKVKADSFQQHFPYGIYSIPEISMVGQTEEELTKEGIPYEVGKGHYREIARGKIIGDEIGLLKLIFHLETREILGVHIIGSNASELIHIGQAVMASKGTLDYFINAVFNYPTLAECYKNAAYDGMNRLGM